MKFIRKLKSIRNFPERIVSENKLRRLVKPADKQPTYLALGLLMQSALALALLSGCMPQEKKNDAKQEAMSTAQAIPPPSAHLTGEGLIKRGAYLITIGGCNDCHTPKIFTAAGMALDSNRLLSGHPQDEKLPPIPNNAEWVLMTPGATAFIGPWGSSYAANLTPDATGIGNWSYEQFEIALRQGKAKGIAANRPMLPPMPWQNLSAMPDEDLRALFAYLKSLSPVENAVPQPVPPQKLKTLQVTGKGAG